MISVGAPPVNGIRPVAQLEQHDAEREQIGAVIDRMAERLLRRHVRDRAQHHPGHRDLRLGHLGGAAAILDELGEAEVEDLDQAALGAHQVRALDVAVDDAARVRLVERFGDLHGRSRSPRAPAAHRGHGCDSSSPSTYSMTMKSAPACSPMS